jgi:hypothetical protein
MLNSRRPLLRRRDYAIETSQILSMLNLIDEHMDQRNFESAHPGYSSTSSTSSNATALHNIGRARTRAASRYPFQGRVIIQKNNRYIKGHATNLSRTGMFVASGTRVFADNERVRVFIKDEQSDKSYNVIAKVVRFNGNPRFPQGYGLKFVKGVK